MGKEQKQTKDYVVYFTGVKVGLKDKPISEDDDYEAVISNAQDKMCRGEISNIQGCTPDITFQTRENDG